MTPPVLTLLRINRHHAHSITWDRFRKQLSHPPMVFRLPVTQWKFLSHHNTWLLLKFPLISYSSLNNTNQFMIKLILGITWSSSQPNQHTKCSWQWKNKEKPKRGWPVMIRLANFISTRPGLLWRKTVDLEVRAVNTALSIQLMLFWDMSNPSHPLETLSPPPTKHP